MAVLAPQGGLERCGAAVPGSFAPVGRCASGRLPAAMDAAAGHGNPSRAWLDYKMAWLDYK